MKKNKEKSQIGINYSHANYIVRFNNGQSTYALQYNTSILCQLSCYKVNWPPKKDLPSLSGSSEQFPGFN